MVLFNIIIGLFTIAGLIFAIITFLNEKNTNRMKRERTRNILKINIKDNTNYLKASFDKFSHNYIQYKSSSQNNPSAEFNYKIDLVTYFINSYANVSFIDKLKKVRDDIESYYINNINDFKFDYDEYINLNTNINNLIQKLDYYQYQIDIFIPPYDKFLQYNLSQKVIYNNDSISNDIVDNNFNDTGNDNIINPIKYYNKIIRDYDKYFNNLEGLAVPLMNTKDDPGTFTRSFVNIDFETVQLNLGSIIEELKLIN